jgi:hypothetical protein
VYILENNPLPGGDISGCHWGKKLEKGEKKKGENMKEKEKDKRQKGKVKLKGKIKAIGAKIKSKKVPEK